MAGGDSASAFRDRLVRDWYAPRLTPLTFALLPLSWLFRAIVALRRTLFRLRILPSAAAAAPVVVVGNITAGGTGKTPLVAALAQALRDRGRHPGIVSRGYGAAADVPRAVAPWDDPALAGDEPLLLAATGMPVWTGRDRVYAARALQAAHPEVDVILADDGLQHYALRRAVEIVVVDAARGLGNGCLLPAGPLREPPARAAEADALVFNGRIVTVPGLPENVPRYPMRLGGQVFRSLAEPARTARAADFVGRRVHALAGIGNPERFFGSLRELGLEPVCHPFPDHHRYTREELALPDAEVILMTDKDAVKCRILADARMWTLPVTAVLAPGLVEAILEKLDGREVA